MNELIIVKQLPIIEQQLQSVKQTIQERVQVALSYECTTETVKEIKKIRAELSKEFTALEEKRKEVKAAVTKPYLEFESIYKECIEPYKEADSELKNRIASIENELKAEKQNELEQYFNEYAESVNIDFINLSNSGISVTLSASMKSLKEQAKSFIDKVLSDLKVIHMQGSEVIPEVLYEYKQTLNLESALSVVMKRQQAIQSQRINIPDEPTEQKEETTTETVALEPPTVAETPSNDVYALAFKVIGTKEQLKALKVFLESGGYNYEQISTKTEI